MALTTTITAADVAVALGQAAPSADSLEGKQWDMWISDALMLINTRADAITPAPVVDQAKVDYVVRQATVAQVQRPDDATQITVAVDDGSTTRTYSSSRGRVQILDEWWSLLGLVKGQGKAFSIDTAPSCSGHLPWCSLMFGATYCSCGVDIAGYPIFELDGAD